MAAQLNPYLSFTDNAREALEFYADVFGGTLTISTFGEYGDGGAAADLVMHGRVDAPDGLTLMAADTPPGMTRTEGSSITLSLSGDEDATGQDLRRWWQRLADGGRVDVPLETQVWGDVFGQLTDRFGVAWMVNIGQPQQEGPAAE